MSIKILDAPMGFGKTSAMIHMIQHSNPEDRFIFVTPYLDEVDRIKNACVEQNFKVPSNHSGGKKSSKPISKVVDLKLFLEDRENIATTHALFQRLDDEIIQLIMDNHYILILDEVMDVMGQYDITPYDAKLINNLLTTHDEDGMLRWNSENPKYDGKFSEEKRLCEQGMLWFYHEKTLVQMVPVDLFKAFDDVFILTYLFEAQKQRCYFDLFHLLYEYVWVQKTPEGEYVLTDTPTRYAIEGLKDLIHICKDEKLNAIGEEHSSLSKSWFQRNSKDKLGKQLAKNTRNFFDNIMGRSVREVLWTCYKGDDKGKPYISVRNYSSGFLSCNIRATNAYRDRTTLAYAVNRFFSPVDQNFFVDRGIKVDQETWALSEMLQWIWRSAIRDGKEIWVYIPSKRMRILLETWIDKVSNGLVGGEYATLATVSPQQTPALRTAGEKISA